MAVQGFSLRKEGGKRLSANLTVAEFARYDCAALAEKYCGDTVRIDLDLVEQLQKIRDHFAKPLHITSAYRPSGYNAGIGGAANSYHIYGRAADFYVEGVDASTVAAYAQSIGCMGIGLYTAQRFVHIDTRTTRYYWRNEGGGNLTVTTHGGTVSQTASRNPCADWTDYIRAVQAAVGASVDGAAGNRTLNACPTLRLYSPHPVVKTLQHRLNYIGHDCGAADGILGKRTVAAIRAFQQANGLTADGIVGRNTWKRLLELL